ncbi:hypothetical protein AAFX91_14225 [Bradyrhizobium sp. 31Argb]|uniref:hypothetical protein n=1 Tax=Bradyrhizobium sp. 31Argb TaxID=3141247 RepID=UPI003749BB83
MHIRLQAIYGVEDPSNGKRRGDCAIQMVFTDERSLNAELMRFRSREDIGWLDVTDLNTSTRSREYLR